jgi:hypothetical protein
MKKLYKYTLTKDFQKYYPELSGVYFEKRWKNSKGDELYVIVNNGHVTISKAYSWDGCSIKFAKFNYKGKEIYIGTPDGLHDEMKWVSLIHDVLFQFNIGSFILANLIFLHGMQEIKWKMTYLYYSVVSTIGWFWWIT